MRSELGDKARLRHSLEAIEEIEKYLVHVDFPKFIENSMMRFACVKQMQIIEEVSNHLSRDLKSKFSDIAWAQIVGMRNVFTHEYFGIDANLVWEIINKDIPELKAKIKIIEQSLS